jgi:2-amino-4-hydroxy-6-hydroxymethyldihydropteridine diphosphokinase
VTEANDHPGSVLAAIGLGSNLGDRAATIARAIEALDSEPRIVVRAISSLIETPAMTLPGASSQPAYLNGAIVVETDLPARELLDSLLRVERALGRDRVNSPRWSARTIDLDLLLYGDRVIDEPGLVVPHPGMHEREFVLAPLEEVAPDATHPVLGATVREMLKRIRPEPEPESDRLST